MNTRRRFVQLGAAAAAWSSAAARRGFEVTEVTAQAPPAAMPAIDGQLLTDATSRQLAAADYGGSVHRVPRAVFKPASPADVQRIVAHANRNRIKLAMRGRGHSLYGQAQVADGIVIDSSSLTAIRWASETALDAGPGATWGDVATATIARGLTPPVLPDALMLSVGGTLSAGGTGEMTHRYGAQVDHVLELDVVTGAGDLVTCSPTERADLFHMMLAGLGQCGLIVRARLGVIPAPAAVAVTTLRYRDAGGLLEDLHRLAAKDAAPSIAGEISTAPDGVWRLAIVITTVPPANATEGAGWKSGLRFAEASAAAASPYWNHLDRRSASVAAGRARRDANPSLAFSLPFAATAAILDGVLNDAMIARGIWRIELLPMVAARFTQPLFKVPDGDFCFTLRFQRRRPGNDDRAGAEMLAANQQLVRRALAAGGKVYPPYAPPLPTGGWQAHYGAETWQRFADAKRRYDPDNVLTPGAGLFGKPVDR